MKLYSFQPSPYGSRVRLALRRKSLAFEVAPPPEVDPQRSNFLAPSPMGVQNAPRKLFGMADPAQRDAAAIDEAFGMIDTALGFVDARLDGEDGWAVGDAPSIADCALVPVLNAVALLGAIHGRSDVITRHPRLGAYWAAAQKESVNAELVAEQLAGLPPPLRSFASPVQSVA